MIQDEFRAIMQKMPECIRYQEKERELLRIPGLTARVDELRREIYELYADDNCHDLMARTDVIKKKYADLLGQEEVREYLRAEAVYLKKVRLFIESGARAVDLRSPF